MEDFYINSTSQNNSSDYSNITSNNDNFEHVMFIMNVVEYIIIGIGLPLTLVAIYALYSLVRNDHVAPIYVINLLITDLIQLCCLIVKVASLKNWTMGNGIVYLFHRFAVAASIFFMVCVALERYLVVAWPLWYRFRRTIKTSVVVCVAVWIFALVLFLTFYFWFDKKVYPTVSAVVLLLPFPLLIFFLGGTLKALSACRIPSDEKRRIVGVLVLVLLIYTLLFMPRLIWLLSDEGRNNFILRSLSDMFVKLSPLADLFLYVFMRKGIIDKLLASVCCCRMDSNDVGKSSGNDDSIYTVSSV
ncbi:G-protein coupled receptor 4-like [Larimichthys crocea]|uniref:G-protein coupled receptor 4-like n=1 Tax=Larimichthys crocea TaxID=215358 RepID=UPI000F5ED52A|nr:G-protein coupled receptor 4-like [Larimichthys crocea]